MLNMNKLLEKAESIGSILQKNDFANPRVYSGFEPGETRVFIVVEESGTRNILQRGKARINALNDIARVLECNVFQLVLHLREDIDPCYWQAVEEKALPLVQTTPCVNPNLNSNSAGPIPPGVGYNPNLRRPITS